MGGGKGPLSWNGWHAHTWQGANLVDRGSGDSCDPSAGLHASISDSEQAFFFASLTVAPSRSEIDRPRRDQDFVP